MSKRKYTDEWLAEQNKKENTPREYMGKEYTLYDALQHQRKLERTIRKQKQDVKLLERARADEEDIIAAKCRLRLTNQNYVDFSKAMGIRQQLERLRTVKEQSDVSAKQSRFPVGTAQRTTHYRDSTDEWKEVSPEQAKNVTDLKEYEIGGRKYVVDGRNVVLDYKPYERKIAEIIAKKYGKSVQMIPRIINPKGKKTADFLIDGILYDLKTPEGNGKNTIDGILKTGKGQAERFILSLDKTPMDMSEIMRQLVNTFKTDHLKFMKEVVIYKNDNILNVFQRKI